MKICEQEIEIPETGWDIVQFVKILLSYELDYNFSKGFGVKMPPFEDYLHESLEA